MVALRLDDIADGDDADEPTLVEDGQVADAPLRHGVGDGGDVVRGQSHHDVPRHEALHRALEDALVADRLAHDVALGDDPDGGARLAHHDERADVVLGEEPERLTDGLLGPNRDHAAPLARQDVRDGHRSSPVAHPASFACSRSAYFCVFPVDVLGKGPKTTCLGTL